MMLFLGNVGLSQVEDPKIGGPTCTFGVKDIEHARGQPRRADAEQSARGADHPGLDNVLRKQRPLAGTQRTPKADVLRTTHDLCKQQADRVQQANHQKQNRNAQ